MATSAKYYGLVPAAGQGKRFGADAPKQYADLGGLTVLERSVNALLADDRVHKVFVVCAPDDTRCASLFESVPKVKVLPLGGWERVNTVLNALQYLLENMWVFETDWVLVHDAARPGLPRHLLARLIDQASEHVAGGLLALPVADTLKKASVSEEGDTSSQTTVSRTNMWCAQTPQMFRAQALSLALAECLYQGAEVTDEASAIETMGISPLLVMGGLENMKITQAQDLEYVRCLLNLQPLDGEAN